MGKLRGRNQTGADGWSWGWVQKPGWEKPRSRTIRIGYRRTLRRIAEEGGDVNRIIVFE
jgi:hypothetical protein